MPESINSVSSNFRDFLLNRNLVTDTVTENGLSSLLGGIGLPITNIGSNPEAVQASPNIQGDGELYKDLNVINNKFQGTDDDYRVINMSTLAASRLTGPPPTAFIYSPYYTTNYGILDDTLNVPATGPFQGGDIRQFNTSFNLYDDPSKRLLVDMTDVSRPNVKYTNYIDLNSGIDQIGLNLLGSILSGRGVGIGGSGNLVPDFDLRATLVGRVLGGTGVISDTPLGQAGAKYLALALANNAAFGLQQETIGHLNLNPLNIAMNGVGSIVVPNYDITVPKSTLGRVLNFGAKVLGFESPISLYVRASSIFASENPVSNITRAQSQILNSGKGQVLSLFANLKQNKYIPKYEDKRVKSASNRAIDDGTNGNLYAFEDGEGGIQDLLNAPAQDSLNSGANGQSVSEGDYTVAPEAGGSVGFESNYGKITSELDGIATGYGSGFDEDTFSNIAEFGEDSSRVTQYIWGDTGSNAPGKRVFNKDRFTSEKALLTKTQSLFKTNKMRTLTSGKAVIGEIKSDIQSSVFGGFMSKGSGVLSQTAIQTLGQGGDLGTLDAENVFCRTWTTFDKYNQVQDLQKSSGIDGRTAYRNDFEDSVLDSNGFVKIAPYVGDDIAGADGNINIKNFMFSIENLAWSENHEKLLPCEMGPGDLMTGKKGRIMWFPPYDISITENTGVSWESTNFIGRGEPVYTYNNTERTGTLQFKIVVDHPSYLNALKSESDEYIASFFAGCTDIDPELAKKLTTTEKSEILTRNAPTPQKKETEPISPSLEGVSFYFPNDVTKLDPNYEDTFQAEGGGLGTITSEGIVDSKPTAHPDNTDFGLNGDKNPELSQEGGWRTFGGRDVLRYVLNEECQACKVKIKGFASITGGVGSSANQELSDKRAASVKAWFIENVIDGTQEIYGGTGITVDDRFESTSGEGTTDDTPCPQLKDSNGQAIDTSDYFGCKVNRKVEVSLVFDTELANRIIKEDTTPKVVAEEKYRVNQTIINRFYNECNYFEKLRQEDAVVYDSLKQKLKFFHPAFHAITPEGLNSRLTFLQQCTRQGPTNLNGRPDNLAFGAPPVCILRLGDFYHTKIVIDNLGITYEPLVWDLNPEGIGVQPMIASVDLSFKMIGGQSLKGPINKLQNAVSFNFFGNTGVYDVRADRIAKVAAGNDNLGDYELVLGAQVFEPIVIENEEALQSISDGDVANNQEAQADATPQEGPSSGATSDTSGTTATTVNTVDVAKSIGIKQFEYGNGNIDLVCSYSPEPKFRLNENGPSIRCQVYVTKSDNTQLDAGQFTISYNTANNTNVENSGLYDENIRQFTVSLAVDDIEDELNTAISESGSNLQLVKTVEGNNGGKANIGFNNTSNKF